MTTIACDGRTMAADSQETTGGDVRIRSDAVKVALLDDGTVLGVSGDANALPAFVKWLNAGSPRDDRPTGFDATLLRLRPDGTVEDAQAKSGVCWAPRPAPCALGTGQEFALGAMAAGADAAAAVEIAIRYDVFSGGSVLAIQPKD